MRAVGFYAFAVVSLAASGAFAESPGLGGQIARCLNPPPVGEQSAAVRMHLNARGELIEEPTADSSSDYAKAAVRAVRRCAPYDLDVPAGSGPFQVELRFTDVENVVVVSSDIPSPVPTERQDPPPVVTAEPQPEREPDVGALILLYAMYAKAEACAASGASFTAQDVAGIKVGIEDWTRENPIPRDLKDKAWDIAARNHLRTQDAMTYQGCVVSKAEAYGLFPNLADGQVPANPF